MAAVDNSLMTAKGVTLLKYRSSKFVEIDIALNFDHDDDYIASYSSCRRNVMTLTMMLMSQMKRK